MCLHTDSVPERQNKRRESDSHPVLINTASLELMTMELMADVRTVKNPLAHVQMEFLLAILPFKNHYLNSLNNV